jgi:hypothetical protein
MNTESIQNHPLTMISALNPTRNALPRTSSAITRRALSCSFGVIEAWSLAVGPRAEELPKAALDLALPAA